MVRIIDQLVFKMTGRSVPAMRVSEVDKETGQIFTFQDLGYVRDDPNRLVRVWDQRAWEKKQGAGPIVRINKSGIPEMCYVVTERGETCKIYTQPWEGPALENVIGKQAALDVIADVMGLVPSMRDKIIFMVVGIFLGAMIIGPMFSTMLS